MSAARRHQHTASSIATGISNFSAQYNFQSIAIVLIMMSASECTTDDDNCRDGTQESWVEGSATAVIFVGAVVSGYGNNNESYKQNILY